ncbi:MAG: hypothetical protein U9N77_07500 [Thermodesulfobacteriota bacterium]|nr:hypothetical protein [Thermodesulfobacteriota bacterium]
MHLLSYPVKWFIVGAAGFLVYKFGKKTGAADKEKQEKEAITK